MTRRVSNAATIATMPTGTSKRRSPMPDAFKAVISLSAERRPRPISTPTKVAIGSVNANTGVSEHKNSNPILPAPLECRTISSMSRTSCGTKKTKVNMARPSSEWEKTSRQMYLSRMRIVARGHSSMMPEGCSRDVCR